jgi:hypothetical protein
MTTTYSASPAGHRQRLRRCYVETRRRALVAWLGILGATACGGRSVATGPKPERDAQTFNSEADAGTTAGVDASRSATLTSHALSSSATPPRATATLSSMPPPVMGSASSTAPTAEAPTATPMMSTTAPTSTSNNAYLPVDNPPGDLVDCEGRSRHLETSCNYSLVCSNGLVSSSCQEASPGRWSCSCYDSATLLRRDFQLTSDEGQDACVDAVTLCVPSAEPDLEKECVDINPNEAGYGCYSDLQCTYTAALDNGALVELTEFRSTRCEVVGDGLFYCDCGGVMGTNYASYAMLSGITASEACTAADELCGMLPSGELECETLALNADPNSCSQTRVCGEEVTLPESGITTTLVDTYNTSGCLVVENGDWNCDCYGADFNPSSVFPSPASAEEACGGGLLLCSNADALQPAGLPSCRSESVSGMSGHCVASATCIQGGSVAGTPVSIAEPISNDCALEVDGTWQCRCFSLEYSEPFTLEGNEDAPWEVCRSGIGVCGDSARFSQSASGNAHFTFELPTQSAEAGAPTP